MPESSATPSKKARTRLYTVPLIYRGDSDEELPTPRTGRGPGKKARKSATPSSSPVKSKTPPLEQDFELPLPLPPSPPRLTPPPAAPAAPVTATTSAGAAQSTARYVPVNPTLHFDSYCADVWSNTTPFEIVDERTWVVARYDPSTEIHPVRFGV